MPRLFTTLRQHRLAAELTQEELAQCAGVRRETILHLEAGRYNPSLLLAYRISQVLNVPIDELFWYQLEEDI